MTEDEMRTVVHSPRDIGLGPSAELSCTGSQEPRGEAGTSGFLCVSDSDRAPGFLFQTAVGVLGGYPLPSWGTRRGLS